uniref:Menm n=1 Tax=Biston betularia TaxID=82595 RepID=A0A173FDK0_BISBE|nr:menm [Biston betularia]
MAEKPVRLYLQKPINEFIYEYIYIDTIRLPQHQYDGIRFLYREYKKGKIGVILNDPTGYGKRVQTILFILAMHRDMALPTLILCNEGFEEVWTEQFQKWTNIAFDISVQKGNEYRNTKCVIGSFSHINALCRREWGIIVIDDNNVSKEILRAWVCAKYRIWLVSCDLKKDLHSFALIYKWYYPRIKFIPDHYQSDKKPASLLSNSVKLDAIMEDIVLRRRDVAVPLGQPSHTPDPIQGTRKNKDITGKKIKRSKRLPDKDINTSAESQETGATNGEVKEHTFKTMKYKKDRIDVTNYCSYRSRNDYGAQVKSDNIELNTDNEVFKSVSTVNPDTRDENDTPLNSEIHSQNFILKFDSETQDTETGDDIPAKKSKVTNEINIS